MSERTIESFETDVRALIDAGQVDYDKTIFKFEVPKEISAPLSRSMMTGMMINPPPVDLVQAFYNFADVMAQQSEMKQVANDDTPIQTEGPLLLSIGLLGICAMGASTFPELESYGLYILDQVYDQIIDPLVEKV